MSVLGVLTVGRVGVDLYPQRVGVPLDQVETFVAGRLACSDAMPTIAEVTALWGDVPLEDSNA